MITDSLHNKTERPRELVAELYSKIVAETPQLPSERLLILTLLVLKLYKRVQEEQAIFIPLSETFPFLGEKLGRIYEDQSESFAMISSSILELTSTPELEKKQRAFSRLQQATTILAKLEESKEELLVEAGY
jgi:hypothetical protein